MLTGMTVANPKLRWYQFSLLALMVFVTLLAVGCSWLAVKMKAAKRQREAVAEIYRLGGSACHDWQCSAEGYQWAAIERQQPPVPRWLRNLLGDDFFGDVCSIHFNAPQATDATFEPFTWMSRLRYLNLDNTQVTDITLERINGLNQLKHLRLRNTKVTDEGVRKLQQAVPNCEIER
jgi:hypothetical protein